MESMRRKAIVDNDGEQKAWFGRGFARFAWVIMLAVIVIGILIAILEFREWM